MTDYCTVEAVKRWASDQPDYFTDATGDPLDDVLMRAIAAASRAVEADTGRLFYASEEQARLSCLGDDGTVRFVDLIAGTVTSVLYDSIGDGVPDTELELTDYILFPFTDAQGRPAERYQRMRRRPGATRWPQPGRTVEITADWGYVDDEGEPPADIVQACIILAGRLFVRREAKLGVISVPSLWTVGMMKGRDQDYMDAVLRYVHPDHVSKYALT